MNGTERFERHLAELMAAEGGSGVPDALVDDALSSTSRMRPRPRWLALLKETPMRFHARVAVGSPAARMTYVLALTLGSILAMAAAAVAGATLLQAPDVSLASADWPMARGDAARRAVGVDGPAGQPVLRWQYQASGSIGSSVSVVGDLAYTTSDEGILHAVDVMSGEPRWQVAFDVPRLTGALVDDGSIYTIDGAGSLHALDALTGELRWTSADLATRASAPTTGDGALYAGSDRGELVAIDTSSGAERWRTRVSDDQGQVHAPAFADGYVYVASVGGGFVSIEATTGSIAWRFDTGEAETGTAVVADGVAYMSGSTDSGAAGVLWAVDAATGRMLWQVDKNLYTPAVLDGVAYAGSEAIGVHALDTATGEELWTFPVEGLVRPVAIADGVVYFPDDPGHRVYALDSETGAELWRFDVDGGVTSGISVARGAVYVGTFLGNVYAIAGEDTASSGETSVRAYEGVADPDSAAAADATLLYLWESTGGPEGPHDVTIAPDGNLWVADSGTDRFHILDPDGTPLEAWGEPGSGPGQFLFDTSGTGGDIAFDSEGRMYVADIGNARVQVFGADRAFLTEWGGPGRGDGQFITPYSIAVDADDNVYVSDYTREDVQKFSSDGEFLLKFGESGTGDGQFNYQGGLTIDDEGTVWVADFGNGRVQRFSTDGVFLEAWPEAGTEGDALEGPGNMAVDSAGQLYIADTASHRIVIVDADGYRLAVLGGQGADPGQFDEPPGVAVDADGSIYVADLVNGRVQKFRMVSADGT